MNNYNKINNLVGWMAFAISFIVYALTMEPTASFWDCGEFISASYGLQVVHPPGAPLFLILGRFFSLFAGDNLQMVAPMVNLLSVSASALCVMFTFWITTYFGKRLVAKTTDNPTMAHTIAIMGAGLVGALTLTFSDTFWFSAVEAEVYASSSFFTALTFWAILKWEANADKKHSDRWLVFIGYIIGLAVGVHLLNLLVIPAIVFVYYFRRYPGRITRKGIIISGGLSLVLLVFVQLGVIPGIPALAAKFDLAFVNGMGLPFGSGALFFLLLLIGGTIFGLIYSKKKGKVALNTALLAFSFIVIGYSSYSMVVIRSLANPPIDMNNPEDPFNLVYYLNREQYGDRPLLYGPYFTARPTGYELKSEKYIRIGESYKPLPKGFEYTYEKKDKVFFPRIYDGNDQSHIRGYKEWTGLRDGRKPEFKHNITFFINYQLGWMYWRYFMWNFSGRQNDDQGYIGKVDGNWISGIGFIDEARLGPQDNLPDTMAGNKGRNKYYMLPFLLGLIGIFFHIKTHKEDSFILGVLFLITGAILIVYLNPPPYEPRERDYVFVGSFQVFSSWVGLAVLGLFTWLSKKITPQVAAIAATVGCLVAAPVLMASQNWDDHDRSGRYMTIDFAKNYLNSCPKNAILLTNGDNDTYPLWYAQNVEKYRTDVRVINYSLLGAGEYANGLRQQTYESEPIKFTFNHEQIIPGVRDYLRYNASNKFNQNAPTELKDVMKFLASDNDADKIYDNNEGKLVNFVPTKKYKISLDMQKFVNNNWIDPNDTLNKVNELVFDLPGNTLYKNGLLLLDIVASNINDRPICFTTTTGPDVYLNMMEYFEDRGLVYRLVPYKTPVTDQYRYGKIVNDTLHKLLVDTYKWGGMEEREMFVDDKAKLVPSNVRGQFARLAGALLQAGDKERAIATLDHSLVSIPHHNMPFDYNMLNYIDIYYRCEAPEKAEKLMDILAKDAKQKFDYFRQFSGSDAKDIYVKQGKEIGQQVLQNCAAIANQYGRKEKAEQIARMIQ
jgi:hypothetical protein